MGLRGLRPFREAFAVDDGAAEIEVVGEEVVQGGDVVVDRGRLEPLNGFEVGAEPRTA